MPHQAKGQMSRRASFSILRDTVTIHFFSSQPLAHWYRILAVFALTWVLAPTAAFAQLGGIAGGEILQIIGMVQVEPGSNVLTLKVKDDVIRFAVNGIDTRNQNFSVPQFLSEARHREPSLQLRGPEPFLDMLLKERPGKRVLKLTGRYYQDSHRFMLDDINRLEDNPTPR
jgi:hypothetical protein